MVNWLRSLFRMLLNTRKRVRYIDTLLRRYKFTESDIETALLLYDHMKVMFVDDMTGSLYIGKRHSDGFYDGQCIGYCGRDGAALYNIINGIYPPWRWEPFMMSRLFEENPRLFEEMDIPKFKSTAELRMKLELRG